MPGPPEPGASRVEPTYIDAFGKQRRVSPEARHVVEALVAEAPGEDPVAIVPPGSALPFMGEVTLEDGTALGTLERLPADVPVGYHRLAAGARERLLISGPGRCHLPPNLRAWGWAIQLATTRSERSWGIGDLDDLAALARWSAGAGAGFVAVGPLAAPNPGPDPDPSPYYPSTRRWGNPLHLAVARVPGADRVPGMATLASAGRALNERPVVDRRAVSVLKLEALERAFAVAAARPPAFDAWRRAQGEALQQWGTFVVLCELHGADWRRWPEALRHPDRPSVRRAAQEHAERVAFHAWLQWCFDRQLADASRDLLRIADMPVGVDPGGFDAWAWQDVLLRGATLGVPPDRFNARGQDWGMPPYDLQRLRRAGYGPFVDTLRAQLRHAGGLRLDHVIGLFRQWWVPSGADPTAGAYVRQFTDELLEIVALESHRAGAVVVGEDLGTVSAGVRRELRRRRLLSTRLALFESQPPDRWPRQAVAGVSTHDLPTIAGIWTDADLADQAAAGLAPDPAEQARARRRLARAAGVGESAGAREVAVALHRRLAASPPMLVAATLEDALGVAPRPNIPGTVRPQRDNWSLALPTPIDAFASDHGVLRLVEALRRG